nr:MAG TPA_asm: hypothetical protein [Caudoviricetes sp.]
MRGNHSTVWKTSHWMRWEKKRLYRFLKYPVKEIAPYRKSKR